MMRHRTIIMTLTFALLISCCLRPAMANAVRWEQLMEAGHAGVMLDYSRTVYGDWDASVASFRAAVKEAELTWGSQDPHVADSLDALGNLLLHPKDMHYAEFQDEAGQCILRAKDILVTRFGKDSPEVARSLCWVAHLDTHLDKDKEALQLYRHAVALARNGFGENSPRYADVLLLASPFFEDSRDGGSLSEQEYDEQAIRIYERAYGKDSPSLIPALLRQVELNNSLQYLSFGEPAYQRALAIAEKAYGSEDARLLPILQRYALLITNAREVNLFVEPDGGWEHVRVQAEQLNARYLQLAEHQAGKDSPSLLPVLLQVAANYHTLQRNEKAWDTLVRALQIAEAHYGKDGPRILDSLYALADWSADEDPMHAEALYLRAVHLCELAGTSAKPRLHESMERLIAYYEKIGELRKAMIQNQRLFSLRDTRSQCDEYLQHSAILGRFFAFYKQQRDPESIIALLERMNALIAQHFGANSPQMRAALVYAADVCLDDCRDEPREAEYLQRALTLDTHPGAASDLLIPLALCEMKLGEFSHAEQLLKQALREAHAGEQQTSILDSLAEATRAQRKYADEQVYLARIVQFYERNTIATVPAPTIRSSQVGFDPVKEAAAERANSLTGALMNMAVNAEAQGKIVQSEEIWLRVLARLDKDEALPITREEAVRRAREFFLRNHLFLKAEIMLHSEEHRAGALKGDERLRESLQILSRWAQLYIASGDTAGFERTLASLQQRAKQTDTPDGTLAYEVLRQLPRELQQMKAYTFAERLLRTALADEDAGHGQTSIKIEEILDELGSCLEAQGKLSESTVIFQRLEQLEAAQQYDGNYSRDVVGFYCRQQRYADAEAFLRKQLAVGQQHFGMDSENTEDDLLSIAEVLVAQQRFSEAETLYRQILTTYENAPVEPSDGQTESPRPPYHVQLALAKCYLAWKKPQQALPLFTRALMQARLDLRTIF